MAFVTDGVCGIHRLNSPKEDDAARSENAITLYIRRVSRSFSPRMKQVRNSRSRLNARRMVEILGPCISSLLLEVSQHSVPRHWPLGLGGSPHVCFIGEPCSFVAFDGRTVAKECKPVRRACSFSSTPAKDWKCPTRLRRLPVKVAPGPKLPVTLRRFYLSDF